MYEAFYRGLDPQLGRFWEIDPATNYDESPYASMQNDPVLKMDWLGDYFTWSSSSVEDRYKRLRKDNSDLIEQYTKELSSLDLTSTDKNVQKQISELTTLINMHGALSEQWDDMASSGIEFHVSDEVPHNSAAEGETGFVTKENRVDIRLGPDDKRTGDELMAHEFRHGYGYITGEMMEGNMLYDMTDEVNAFDAGYIFLDRNTANLVADNYYDINWFKKAELKSYKNLIGKEESLTINTPAAVVMKYYNNDRISFFMGLNKNNSNMTMKQVMDALNSYSKQNPPEFRYGNLLSNKPQ
jgi:hypothetical protein